MKIVLLRRIVKIRREKRLNQFDKGGIMKSKLGCSALCFLWRRQPGFLSGEGAVWNQEKHNGRPLAPKGPESLLILIPRNRRKSPGLLGKRNRFFPRATAWLGAAQNTAASGAKKVVRAGHPSDAARQKKTEKRKRMRLFSGGVCGHPAFGNSHYCVDRSAG